MSIKQTIIVKTGKKYSFINMSDINWIESDNGYLKIHLDDSYYIVTMTLSNIKEKINSNNFIRINRSNIINISKVKEMVATEKTNDYKVILKDKTILKWGRRYRSNFPASLLIT